jgi:hypothetical protein
MAGSGPNSADDPMRAIALALSDRARTGVPLNPDEASLFRDLISYYSRQSQPTTTA